MAKFSIPTLIIVILVLGVMIFFTASTYDPYFSPPSLFILCGELALVLTIFNGVDLNSTMFHRNPLLMMPERIPARIVKMPYEIRKGHYELIATAAKFYVPKDAQLKVRGISGLGSWMSLNAQFRIRGREGDFTHVFPKGPLTEGVVVSKVNLNSEYPEITCEVVDKISRDSAYLQLETVMETIRSSNLRMVQEQKKGIVEDSASLSRIARNINPNPEAYNTQRKRRRDEEE